MFRYIFVHSVYIMDFKWCFLMIRLYLWYKLFIWYNVLFIRLLLISIMCIYLYYHTQDDTVHLTSFFYHQIIFFSRVLLNIICLFFSVRSVCWIKNVYAKYIMIYLQSYIFIFWFIHKISFFDHQNFFVLGFLFIHWISLFDYENINRK